MFLEISICVLSVAVIFNALTINVLRKVVNKNSGLNRFEQLLVVLGYQENVKPYHRGNLIDAVMNFAIINNDKQLEVFCQKELEQIRTLNEK